MLVSGADIQFVAAAVQSWSLPQFSQKESSYGTVNLKSSIALLLLAGLVNAVHSLVLSSSWLGKALLLWAVAEVLYAIHGYCRYSSVNRVVEVPLNAERVELIKQRFLTLSTVMPMEDFLSGWFRGAQPEQIKRRNVEDFVAYGFYCRRIEQLSPKLQRTVADFVREVEVAYGRTLEDGVNPDISFMAHMWEPLRMLPTPLCVHVGSVIAGLCAEGVLALWGFKKHSCEGLGYWYRPGGREAAQEWHQQQQLVRVGVQTRSMTASSIHRRGDSASSVRASSLSDSPRPLVFIHGVGFGIVPYLGFLWQMFSNNPGHPVVLLDIPHVALRPFTRAKNVDDIAAAVQKLMQRHGLGSACFAGHSFGSFCISRICQLYPDIVNSIALMDPVCCLTCYPQLLSSFIYKGYSWQEATSSFIGFANAVRFIFSRDLIIAETFCRQFLWHALMLWPDDMPSKAVISVSANDDLVPAELVRAHLRATKSSATVMLHPTAAHGGIFLDPEHLRELLSHIQNLLRG